MILSNYSIRKRLVTALILSLSIISLSFIFFMAGLFLCGYILTPEATAQIASALATLLVIVLTLGLRLIDDALNRYESHTKQKVKDLKSSVERVTSALLNNHNDPSSNHNRNLPSSRRELTEYCNNLEKHEQFFLTRLYPSKLPNKIKEVCRGIETILSIIGNYEQSKGTGVNMDHILSQFRTANEKIIGELQTIVVELNEFLDAN
jgi:hypothetical protein